ncbi:MAG TPA: DUF922 domain-containing protein [Geomonas sp.]|nr:DUF922 domain-containing protein [Geomonas sp.]
MKEKYEYYDIEGVTVGDLQKAINHNGTKWGDGITYAAVTTWNIHYDYDVTDDDGRCSVKAVRTSVEIVYHLPRWLSPDSAGTLLSSWNDYMAHLKKHEFGHKEIAVKSAGEINEVLASLQNFKNESDLDKEAKRRTNEKLRELKDLQVAYDAKTRHGATQGAVLASQ